MTWKTIFLKTPTRIKDIPISHIIPCLSLWIQVPSREVGLGYDLGG